MAKETESDKRSRIEFYIKNGAMIAGAVWVVWTGTDYLDKKNKTLSVESTPTADTKMEPGKKRSYYSKLVDGKDTEYCVIDGKYIITNSGKLSINIKEVSFEVYKLENIDNPNGSDEAVSFSYSERIDPDNAKENYAAVKVLKEPVILKIGKSDGEIFGENLGPENQLQRLYGFVIQRDKRDKIEGKNFSYSVVARAQGGLSDVENSGFLGYPLGRIWSFLFGSSERNFDPDDLMHAFVYSPICNDPESVPSPPST